MTTKEPYDPNQYTLVPHGRFMAIHHPHGDLIYSFYPDSGWMNLSALDVDTDFRGNGIAKNMLRYSKDLAEKLGAKLVIGAITSREAYDAVVAIYGPEHVEIAHLGDYMPPGIDYPEFGDDGTNATLLYPVLVRECQE